MTEGFGRSLGRYRLERLVGRGGMAEVWEARDQTLGRRVAVKIILPNLAAETRFHERFLSKARSVAALEHDHVLPIYDFGEAEGGPYLVTPWSGNADAAISWYKRVLTTRDRTEIGAMLRTLSQEEGPELVGRACAEGFTPACDNVRPAHALRRRRPRRQCRPRRQYS